MGKTKGQTGKQTASNCNNTCEELQASNCVYKSRGAPAGNIGPPLIKLGKQLTSIASRLTLPKLHLAACNTEPLMPKNFERRERRIAWLFLIMINNLNAGGEADMWKCVDDTTISEVVDKDRESCI